MSHSRLFDATPVLPAVAARVLKVSVRGLFKLAETGKLRYERTGGDPSIRIYRWGDVLRLAERRGKARAFRSLPETARMVKAEFRQPSFRWRSERPVPTSAPKGRAIVRESVDVA